MVFRVAIEIVYYCFLLYRSVFPRYINEIIRMSARWREDANITQSVQSATCLSRFLSDRLRLGSQPQITTHPPQTQFIRFNCCDSVSRAQTTFTAHILSIH